MDLLFVDSANGKPVNLAPYFFHLAADLAMLFIRGKSTDSFEHSITKKENQFLEAMKLVGVGCGRR